MIHMVCDGVKSNILVDLYNFYSNNWCRLCLQQLSGDIRDWRTRVRYLHYFRSINEEKRVPPTRRVGKQDI